MDVSEEHDAHGEGYAKRDAEGGVGLEPAHASQSEDDKGRSSAGDQRSGQNAAQIAGTGDEEAEADTGEGGMRQRVAKEALFAQDGKAAEQTARNAEQGRAHGDGLNRVVGQQFQHVSRGF